MDTDEMLVPDEFLPDFSGVKDFADIQRRFISSARAIMLEHKLAFGGKCFDITALELYLKLHKQRNVWWDAATDDDDNAKEQFKRGTWYVRNKKGPAYWRIDISAGNVDQGIQAGILIRQLDGSGGQSPGPSTALQRIVRGNFGRQSWTEDELGLIGRIHGKRIDGGDGSPLILKRRATALPRELSKGS